jgi:ABC-type nitrate/sulfonate/bicarbonate transport system ATPase subunit
MPAKGASVIEIEAPEKEPLLFGPVPRAVGVKVRGLAKSFSTRNGLLDVLEDVSFDVAPLEAVGIVGPSGCGKSTLLELISGLDDPTRGDVELQAEHLSGRRLASCALMPQRDLLLPWRTALDNAALSLELAGLRRSEARARVAPLFERFGLAGFQETSPSELSGGMRQRVAFLRTLLAGKPVLLLDEPFGSLDSITRADMQEWLASALRAEPRTVVLVTHDVEEALFLCDRVLVLSSRPASVKSEIDVHLPRDGPRRETVTDPAFTALKQQALEALE